VSLAESPEHWEREANNWIAWARTAGHDEYWCYREQRLRPCTRARGRNARDRLRRGSRQPRTGRAGASRDGRRRRADAPRGGARRRSGRRVRARRRAALPFADRSFDLVVAHNSPMDVDDFGGTVRDAGASARAEWALLCMRHPSVADRLAGHGFPCSRGRPLESSTVTDSPNNGGDRFRGGDHPMGPRLEEPDSCRVRGLGAVDRDTGTVHSLELAAAPEFSACHAASELISKYARQQPWAGHDNEAELLKQAEGVQLEPRPGSAARACACSRHVPPSIP
jgi:hypothetical protein